MHLKKLAKRLVLTCLCAVLLASCLPAQAGETTVHIEYVTIEKFGFVADTLNGVEAKYNPWGSNYDCSELIHRYYKEIYGVRLGLYGNAPHVLDRDDVYFERVSEPQVGDVLFATAYMRGRPTCHWAICKSVDTENNTITMFEQNWRVGGTAAVNRQIPYEKNCYYYYRLMTATGPALTLEQEAEQQELRRQAAEYFALQADIINQAHTEAQKKQEVAALYRQLRQDAQAAAASYK